MNEEQDVLASLQASLHDQTVYEDDVLRQARHQLAPTLSLGFPDLSDLYNVSTSNMTVVHAVLAKVRREIVSLTNNINNKDDTDSRNKLDLLYMKEQMLLNVIKNNHPSNANVNEEEFLPVRLIEERAAEQARSRKIIQQQQRNGGTTTVNLSGNVIKTKKQQPQQQQLPSKKKKRVPMMQRKQIGRNHNDDGDNDENVKSVSELKQLREERLRRRRERRKQFSDTSSDEESSEEEFQDKKENNSADNESNINQDSKEIITSSLPENESKTATCPICQEVISMNVSDDVDMILSQHMSQCQTTRRSTRRSTRSSSNSAMTDCQTTAVSTTQKGKRKKSNVSSKKKSSNKKAKINVSAENAVDDIEEWVYEDRVDDWIEHGLGRMKKMREQDETEIAPGDEEYEGGLLIPAWINDRLFSYQREGVRWMWDLHRQMVGGCVGDEMGLGKTVQVAAYLGAAAASRKLKSVLVVAPETLLQHWLSELAVWAPGLRRILIHTSGGDVDGLNRNISSQMLQKLSKWLKEARANRLYEAIDDKDWETESPHSFCGTGFVIVTTYENFRRNADIYTGFDWSYIVLDEAQKIQNPDADVTISCKRIRTPHRLAMSGTPIQNDLKELWSLFDFVFPGRLGTLPAFEQEFAVPIKRGGYSNASPMQVQLAYRCSLMLRDLIEPFLLRRLKRDVKEVSRMPGKTEHVLFCRLSRRQRDMYEAFLQSDEVSRVLRGTNQMLAAVTMLRKISNHPDLVCDPSEASFQSFIRNRGMQQQMLEDSSDMDDDEINEEDSLVERSGKLEVLSKILPLWHKQGHRVLIFCQWRKMLNIIQRFTMMKGWSFLRLDGNTNIAARQRLVDSFNNDESYFGMLCTTRTGGVGLNLTGANRIILYEPDWNPSADSQAKERAFRFGQKKDVTIYRLITAGTIEEKIYQRQIFKTALSNKILQDPKQRRLFSQRHLRDLFTLGADTGSVRAGGDGITETTRVTKGVGVVDREADVSGGTSDGDDQETLRKVMKSKGLAGVFDHHYVEPEFKRKSATVREMEEDARKVANEAVETLRKSIASKQEPYAPTWTGSKETLPSRLGPSNRENIETRSAATGPLSSNSLLATLRQRNGEIETSGSVEKPADNESSKKYANLLSRLQKFIRSRRPTTDEILQHFDDVLDADVAIFRRLLKSAADIRDGRWYVKQM